MKLLITFITSFIICLSSLAQERCSTNEYVEFLFNQLPQYKEQRKKVNIETQNGLNQIIIIQNLL